MGRRDQASPQLQPRVMSAAVGDGQGAAEIPKGQETPTRSRIGGEPVMTRQKAASRSRASASGLRGAGGTFPQWRGAVLEASGRGRWGNWLAAGFASMIGNGSGCSEPGGRALPLTSCVPLGKQFPAQNPSFFICKMQRAVGRSKINIYRKHITGRGQGGGCEADLPPDLGLPGSFLVPERS